MTYLLIPIACFVLLAGLYWLITRRNDREINWRGNVEGIDGILSCLMKMEIPDSYLLVKIPDGATWFKMTCPGSLLKLEMPLTTPLQKSWGSHSLAHLRELDLDVHISSNSGADVVLVCEVDGPPANAAAAIKKIFVEKLEIDAATLLEMRLFAPSLNKVALDRALGLTRPGTRANLPTAVTEDNSASGTSQNNVGCMAILVGILLLPIPFVIAYLEFGFLAASAVLVVISVSWEIYRRWKNPDRVFGQIDLIRIVVPILSCTTIYLNDPVYLQFIPTAVLSLAAITELYNKMFNRPPLMAMRSAVSGRRRLLISLAIFATCIGGAALNEYLRANLTLGTWIWFFAFARIELIFASVVLAIPFALHDVRRGKDEINVAESGME